MNDSASSWMAMSLVILSPQLLSLSNVLFQKTTVQIAVAFSWIFIDPQWMTPNVFDHPLTFTLVLLCLLV